MSKSSINGTNSDIDIKKRAMILFRLAQ